LKYTIRYIQYTVHLLYSVMRHPAPFSTLFPYTTLFRSGTTGGAMIPLLTLGIPGEAVTAVLLGALMVQGIQPGPLLFQDNETARSEEHTSELQSRFDLVCRLLLETKKISESLAISSLLL